MQFKHQCSTLDELFGLMALPVTAHDSKLVVMSTIELPVDADDYEMLNGNTINLYRGDDDNNHTSGRKYKISRPNQMSPFTVTVDQPFLATGLCIYLIGDPFSATIEGNQFGPQADILNLAITPASPINLRNQTGALDACLGTHVAGAYGCPAVMEHGGPGWRFINWLMQAWRIVWDCPNSAYQILLNERLSDVGTCLPLPTIQGFSNAEIAVQVLSRLCNARFMDHDVDWPTEATPLDAAPAVTDPGLFVPLNSEQNSDFEITPYRYAKDNVAYGTPIAVSAYENWIKLPIPLALDATTKIRLELKMEDNADELFKQLAISEVMMRQCQGPIPGISGFFPIDEADETPDPDGGNARHTVIPRGTVRLGLGIRGFEVRENVCALYKRVLRDKALLSQLFMRAEGRGGYDPADGCTLGSMSGPNLDQKVREYFGMKPGEDAPADVPAGYVGEEK